MGGRRSERGSADGQAGHAITTVGYGDILPLTDRARIATGLEAVYGVVMAGIFLASLSTQRPRTTA